MRADESERLGWGLRPFAWPGGSLHGRWAAGCRVLTGLLVVHQAVNTYGFAGVMDDADRFRALSLAAAALGGLLTVGLLTPLALAGLIALFATGYPVFNLGVSITLILLWCLLVAGTGRVWGLDGWLPRWAVAPLYMFAVEDSARGAAHVRRFALVAYWGLCLNAMGWHLLDDTWRTGGVLQRMLTNPYWTDWAWLVRRSADAWPAGFEFAAAAGLYVQMAWETLLLPLMFVRAGRWFVVAQGWLFFGTCLLGVNLGYLPAFEVALWLFLFGPGRREAPPADHTPRAAGRVVCYVGCLAAAASVVLFNALLGEALPDGAARTRAAALAEVRTALWVFGQTDVCVLNRVDQETGGVILLISERAPDGSPRRVVPYMDADGGRLGYLRNDLTLYRMSLGWHRTYNPETFRATERDARVSAEMMVRRVCELDARLTPGGPGDRVYRADILVREGGPAGTTAAHAGGFDVRVPAGAADRFAPAFRVPPGHLFTRARARAAKATVGRLAAGPAVP